MKKLAKKVAKKKTVKVKRAPKVDDLYVNFVLDETGSMASCLEATISGFNEYIKTLKKKAKNVTLSLTKFNSSKIDTIYTKQIQDVPDLTEDTYVPDNMTPLYDAIAKTIKDTEKVSKGKDVLCVIMTDGLENASREYSREKIFKLIKEKEKNKWAFAYLGANQDSWEVGAAIGLTKGSVINYATKNMGKTMQYMACVTAGYSSSSSSQRSSLGSKGLFQDKDKKEKELTA